MTTQQTLTALSYPFRVILSPFKAFKEIAQNPSIKGLFVLLALLLTASVGTVYVYASKIFFLINDQYTSFLASNTFSNFMLLYSVEIITGFLAGWFVYASILFVLIGALKEKRGPVRPFYILIGYTFSVLIVRMATSAILVSALPDLPLSISAWPPATEEDLLVYRDQFNAIWAPTLASQASSWLPWIVYGWFVMLTAIAVRGSTETTWGKAIMISVTAYLALLILSAFLPVPLMI